jgi:hypothetical protein
MKRDDSVPDGLPGHPFLSPVIRTTIGAKIYGNILVEIECVADAPEA